MLKEANKAFEGKLSEINLGIVGFEIF